MSNPVRIERDKVQDENKIDDRVGFEEKTTQDETIHTFDETKKCERVKVYK